MTCVDPAGVLAAAITSRRRGDDRRGVPPRRVGPGPGAAVNIDEVRVVRLLQSHEARVNRFGWDQVPHLCLLYDTEERETDRRLRAYRPSDLRWTATTRVAGYAAKAIMTEWSWATPDVMLKALAVSLAYRRRRAPVQERIMQLLVRLPGVLGFGLVYEGWAMPGMGAGPRQDVIDHLHRGGSVRDMPDSVEIRKVLAVDLDGNTHSVHRVRGGRPVTSLGNKGWGFGAMINPLRLLAAVAADTVPPEEEFALRFPELTDLYQPTGSALHERTTS